MKYSWYLAIALFVSALIIGTGTYEIASAQMGGMGMNGQTRMSGNGARMPATGQRHATQDMTMRLQREDAAVTGARSQIMSELRASDARMDEIVSKMNSTTGKRKLDAISKAITELAAQRRQMWDQMLGMQPLMMRDMVGHMQAGMMNGIGQSMNSGPMSAMNGSDGGSSAGAHSGHMQRR